MIFILPRKMILEILNLLLPSSSIPAPNKFSNDDPAAFSKDVLFHEYTDCTRNHTHIMSESIVISWTVSNDSKTHYQKPMLNHSILLEVYIYYSSDVSSVSKYIFMFYRFIGSCIFIFFADNADKRNCHSFFVIINVSIILFIESFF